jgi:uncharacterized protein
MKTPNIPLAIVLGLAGLATLTGTAATTAREVGPVQVKVQPVFPSTARPFALQDVRLLDGPFKHAMELDHQYLLSLDTDRLLHAFRLNAGLPSSAQPLGGWEEPKSEVRGHFVGHYLSACALMYASTGDARVKEKGDAVVAGLAACQAKLGSGYLSAYPESFIDRVEAGQRVWAPYYTLHKILAGLLDMYVECGNRQALATARKFADWVIARNARLSDEHMQRMLNNEHGGMSEGLANLSALTGEQKYLEIALRFNHEALVGPASKHVDNLTGKHANTQIPKFVGAAREYELTGDPTLKSASTFFWETVARERSYVIGGHSDGEMFTPKERLSTAFGPSTTETCNTYNMLKLTRHLFCWDPRVEYADFYERALYNHILASQNPETGGMCYYLPLRSGSRKNYNTPLNDFWCCTGTGVENHAKYGDSIYFNDDESTLFVNLFIASALDWKARGVKVRQETRFPDEEATRLVVTSERPTRLTIKVRRPWWAGKGFAVTVDGENAPAADGWAAVTREWKTGDTIAVALPFALRTEGFPDNPRRFAFMNGPLVLAAQVDPGKPLPIVLGARGLATAALAPVAGKPSTFQGSPDVFRAHGMKAANRLTFEPLYKVHGDQHYMVYFDAYTPEQWRAKEQEDREAQARQKALEARTVDRVNPGEEQDERDHRLQEERSSTGPFGDRHYRHAPGGWFSWELKVRPAKKQELRVTYWGSDAGGRVFDILVDGTKLATERLVGKKPDQFFDQVYPLPESSTVGKSKITVKFQAHPGNTAGGVFGCAVQLPASGN